MDIQNVKVKVLFFAKSREIVGLKESVIDIPTSLTYKNLLALIVTKFQLSDIANSIILSINEELCEDSEVAINLNAGDEIAVIPPLSGG